MGTRLGIDEAGRGCVLGPMVFGGVLIEEDREQLLREAGVNDSKKLSPKRREAMCAPIRGLSLGAELVQLSPRELDGASLNELGKQAVIELCLRFEPDIVVLDAPVPPRQIPDYRADLIRRLAAHGLRGLQVVAENKADLNHPCCSAASVLAKVERDSILAKIGEDADADFGSGYPSDPKTQEFLRRCWFQDGAFPPFVRMKWETVRRLMATDRQARLF